MDPGNDSQADAARIATAVREARARMLWGDPVSAVFDSMMEAGVEGAFAQTVVDAAIRERGAEIRKSGIREIVFFWGGWYSRVRGCCSSSSADSSPSSSSAAV